MSDIKIPNSLLPRDGRFGCGPSKVRAQQLESLVSFASSGLGTSHRQKPVKDLVKGVQEGLMSFFNAPDGYEIILGNGGATAFWDAAVHGLIEEKSQHLSFGEFGAKFAAAAGSAPFLAEPDIISADPGSLRALQVRSDVDLYAYPHNETSTGVMAPVVRAASDSALTVVDATSAAGGIAFDAAQVDVYYFSPQKNFASDGGIWFALVSPRAIERIMHIHGSGRYIPQFLDLKIALDNSRQNQTLNTPALTTLALMKDQVDWLNNSGGLAWADARTRESSNLLYEWIKKTETATPFVSDPAHRSQVVVTIDFDERVDASRISAALRDNGVVDTEPYRKLGRNQLRIATFSAIDPADVSALTECLDYVLERL